MGNTRKAKGDLGWAELLSDARRTVDEVPEEWKSVRQISQETGYSNAHVAKLLKIAVEEGRAERRRFHVDQGYRTYPSNHFRML
jgi:hypothetical protein